MPGGAGPMGYVAFAAVKAVGYITVAQHLRKAYGLERGKGPNAVVVGLARTAIGLVAGTAFGFAWMNFAGGLASAPLFYGLLFPVRLGEWTLLIWCFFDREMKNRPLLRKQILIGTGVSYALDLVGVLAAFVVPGGFWIC